MAGHVNNNKKNYGIFIPGEVLCRASLTPMSKILYGEILLLSIKKGYCFATNAFFAKKYECCHQSIRNWLIELKSENLVDTEVIRVSRTNSKRKIKIIGGLPPNYLSKPPQKFLGHIDTRICKQEGKYRPQNNFDIDPRFKEI